MKTISTGNIQKECSRMPVALRGLFALVLVASLPCSVQAAAAVPSASATEYVPSIAPVVITATRTIKSLADIPASVSVVTREDIQDSPSLNADDLLRGESGVDLKRVAGMGSGIPSRVSLRGIPGLNRVLVLVDGVPSNAAGTGFMSLNEVPLESVDRIEMVRGPFSSLYGANAFAGVINIITRKEKDGPFAEIEGKAGTFGYGDGGLRAGASAGPVSFSAGGFVRSVDNYFARDYIISRSYNPAKKAFVDAHLPADNFGYADRRANARVDVELGGGAVLGVQGSYFDDNLGYGKTAYLTVPRDVRIKEKSAIGALNIDAPLPGGGDATIGGFARQRTNRFWDEAFSRMNPSPPFPVFAPSYTKSLYNDRQGNMQVSLPLAGIHRLTGGGEFLWNQAIFDPLKDADTGAVLAKTEGRTASITNAGLYAQDEVSFTPALSAIPGFRADRNSAFGWAASPKLGVNFKATEDTRFRASAGRAFRAPTLSELYNPDSPCGPGVVLRSNSALKPEYAWAYDAGLEQAVPGGVSFKADGFYNDMKDLIDVGATGGVMQYRNISSARTAGLEAGAEWAAPFRMVPFVNGTYQQTKDRGTGKRLDYEPDWKANFGLQAHIGAGDWEFGFSVTESWTGERTYHDMMTSLPVTLGQYWRSDAALRCSYRRIAWVGVSGQNLTNQPYEETGGILAPGRMMFVEAGARI